MNHRLEIEAYILSACIFCNGYPEIAHILTINNFTDNREDAISNRTIFKSIINLFPSESIDFITVTNELKKVHQLQDINLSFNKKINTNSVSSANNIRYWAFILLQEDIRDKFKKHLIDWRTKRQNDNDKIEVEVITEIIETLTIPSNDVFEVIEKSTIYFNHLKMYNEYQQSQLFQESIADKAKEIKRVNSITKALGFLIEISNNTSAEVQFQCHQFAKVIADMVTTGKTNPQYTNALNLIMGYGV